jgi:hypothetical protein
LPDPRDLCERIAADPCGLRRDVLERASPESLPPAHEAQNQSDHETEHDSEENRLDQSDHTEHENQHRQDDDRDHDLKC